MATSNSFNSFNFECPVEITGTTIPQQSECGLNKEFTWNSPESRVVSLFYYVQNTNKKLISFTFSALTNVDSTFSVKVKYSQDGIPVEQTYDLGSLSTPKKIYHYLDFGNISQVDGLIELEFTIVGGSSASIRSSLNCNDLVSTGRFCYSTLSNSNSYLCTKCPTIIRVYWSRPTSFSALLFKMGPYYLDPELTTLADEGYYRRVESTQSSTIYYFNPVIPLLTSSYFCDSINSDCGESDTQSHLISSYKFSNPFLPDVPNVVSDGLKYSINNYTVNLDTTEHSYMSLTVSYTGNAQKVSFTVSDSNALNGEVGYLAYSNTSPLSTEIFIPMSNQTIFTIPKGETTKTIYLITNSSKQMITDTLKIRVSVGQKMNYSSSASITSTVSSTCPTSGPVYGYDTGLHVYSDYDALPENSYLTTKLYSLIDITNWSINTRVWNDSFLSHPAMPYYYGYGNKVYKVGQDFKRSLGTKTSYVIKSSTARVIAKFLGLTKKSTTINKIISAVKDWTTIDNRVPACINPIMLDVGLIKEIIPSTSLDLPTSYKYLVGYDQDIIVESNNSVFTNYDWSAKPTENPHIPITGFQHAIGKNSSAYLYGVSNELLRNLLASGTAALVALGGGIAIAGITIFASISSIFVAGGPFAMWSIGFSVTLPALSVLGPILIILAVGYLLWKIFQVKTTVIEEQCLLFTTVYTDNEYININDTIYREEILSNVINGYYCDGAYFYTQSSGVVTVEELSYTYNNPPTYQSGPKVFSESPDDPTNVTVISDFFLLPYTSGIPVSYSIPRFESDSITTTLISGDVCPLNIAQPITYFLPQGYFKSKISKLDADAKAQAYFSRLTSQTINLLDSSLPVPGLNAETLIFTHELKIESIPLSLPIAYDDDDSLGIKIGRKLYYDENGCYEALDGYYSISGTGGNYKFFYYVTGGTVVDKFIMQYSYSTQVTSTLPPYTVETLSTTKQDYTSSWFFYSSDYRDVLFNGTNNLFGFNETWNTTSFYNSIIIRRGILKTPTNRTDFYLYDSNFVLNPLTISDVSPTGWYREITGVFNDTPFLWETEFININLNFVQNCTNDDENGILVQCTDDSGNPIASMVGISFSATAVSFYGTLDLGIVNILPTEQEVLIPLSSEYNGVITSVTIISYVSENPYGNITFTQGTSTFCGGFGTGFDNNINIIIRQPDGKLLVGGRFTTYKGISVPQLIRMYPDGMIDTSFTFTPEDDLLSSSVFALALQTDNKILVGMAGGLIRINNDGTNDNSFAFTTNPSGILNYRTISIQSDGKIIAGGFLSMVNSGFLYRFETNGSLDGTFQNTININDEILSTSLQTGGAILVGGAFTVYSGTPKSRLVLLNSNGTIDNGYTNNTFDAPIRTLYTIPIPYINAGNTYVGGGFTIPKKRITLLNSTGVQQSFSLQSPSYNFNNNVYVIKPTLDTDIIVGGSFGWSVGGVINPLQYEIIRLNEGGTRDNSFITGTKFTEGDANRIMTIQSQTESGEWYVGGYFTTFNGISQNRIIKLSPNGTRIF